MRRRGGSKPSHFWLARFLALTRSSSLLGAGCEVITAIASSRWIRPCERLVTLTPSLPACALKSLAPRRQAMASFVASQPVCGVGNDFPAGVASRCSFLVSPASPGADPFGAYDGT